MLDLIFVVDDPLEWHKANLHRHWDHYSAMRRLGATAITRIQSYSAGVYYNTLVHIESQVSVLYVCDSLIPSLSPALTYTFRSLGSKVKYTQVWERDL